MAGSIPSPDYSLAIVSPTREELIGLGADAGHADAQQALPAEAPAVVSGALYPELDRIAARLQTFKCALEPPRTVIQRRRCAAVPTVARNSVRESDVNAILTRLKTLADTSSPADRSKINKLVSWAEITIADHFKKLMGKIAPAQRSVQAAQRAVADDPHSASAATLYGQILIGLRSSAWRAMAERGVGDTTAALRDLAPKLAEHRGDLRAQTILSLGLDSLERDAPLEPTLAALRNGLEQNIAALRQSNPALAEEVDEDVATIRAQASRTR